MSPDVPAQLPKQTEVIAQLPKQTEKRFPSPCSSLGHERYDNWRIPYRYSVDHRTNGGKLASRWQEGFVHKGRRVPCKPQTCHQTPSPSPCSNKFQVSESFKQQSLFSLDQEFGSCRCGECFHSLQKMYFKVHQPRHV